jgi:hypothetical protein
MLPLNFYNVPPRVPAMSPPTAFVSVLRAAGLESLPAEGLVWEGGSACQTCVESVCDSSNCRVILFHFKASWPPSSI